MSLAMISIKISGCSKARNPLFRYRPWASFLGRIHINVRKIGECCEIRDHSRNSYLLLPLIDTDTNELCPWPRMVISRTCGPACPDVLYGSGLAIPFPLRYVAQVTYSE